MVGEGPLKDKVESTLRKLGLTDIVTLLGRQSSAQVADLMRAVDLLCIPSDNEGLPNVLLEAFHVDCKWSQLMWAVSRRC